MKSCGLLCICTDQQQPVNSEENVGTPQVEAEATDFPSDQVHEMFFSFICTDQLIIG